MGKLKFTDKVRDFTEPVHHGFTHEVHGLNEAVAHAMINTMVVHPIDSLVRSLARSTTRENMQVVATPLKTCRKFGSVNTETPKRN
jgi:hypothetical protein